MKQTIWSKMVNNENYLISIDGDILSLPRECKMYNGGSYQTEIRVLTPRYDKKGYAKYDLQGKMLRGHRAVALVFINNARNKPQVNHKNGIPSDNRMENLEWATNSENQMHSSRITRTHMALRFTEEQLREVRTLANQGIALKVLAEQFGMGVSTVSQIKNARGSYGWLL